MSDRRHGPVPCVAGEPPKGKTSGAGDGDAGSIPAWSTKIPSGIELPRGTREVMRVELGTTRATSARRRSAKDPRPHGAALGLGFRSANHLRGAAVGEREGSAKCTQALGSPTRVEACTTNDPKWSWACGNEPAGWPSQRVRRAQAVATRRCASGSSLRTVSQRVRRAQAVATSGWS